jgi:hypothetical protein
MLQELVGVPRRHDRLLSRGAILDKVVNSVKVAVYCEGSDWWERKNGKQEPAMQCSRVGRKLAL